MEKIAEEMAGLKMQREALEREIRMFNFALVSGLRGEVKGPNGSVGLTQLFTQIMCAGVVEADS